MLSVSAASPGTPAQASGKIYRIGILDTTSAVSGLMPYGVSYPDLYRRAATLVDKILKGAKPGDLPVEQPTFELVVNLRTVTTLGLRIARPILLRADKVIQGS
jgi:putative ABC transport system substrate-binding protein